MQNSRAKRLTKEKFREGKNLIRNVREEYELPKLSQQEKGKIARSTNKQSIHYAYEGNSVSAWMKNNEITNRGDPYSTNQKLAISDDYFKKQGRFEEACALLNNALSMYEKESASDAGTKEKARMYEAIEKRALRCYFTTRERDPKVGNIAFHIAEKCEQRRKALKS